ncbi:MAG: polysaccharide biosynthesis protein [Defluviitaleaceae bacterium]|nr:polysaccharide biosynthesis protein [Defluviitaleaceae bacterium]
MQGNFVKQAFILAAAALISRVLGFVYLLPLTAMIGDDGNGLYSRAYYIYNFFLIISSAGLPAAISKLVAERVSLGKYNEARRVFRASLCVAVVLGLICMAAMFFGAGFLTNAMGEPRSYYALIALSPTVFIVAVMAVFRGYFQGLGTMVPTSVSQVVEQIFNVAFSLILASALMGMYSASADPTMFAAAGGTAGTGVGAVFGFFTMLIYFVMHRRSKLVRYPATDNTDKSEISDGYFKYIWLILRTTIPIIAGAAILSFTNLIDAAMAATRLMAGGFTAAEANILYGQLGGKYAHIITLPISIATVFALAAIPSISSSKALKDTAAIENKINTAIRMTMFICVPAAAGLIVLGSPIIAMLFPAFPDGGTLLTVGGINVVLIALNQILTGPLQATGHLKIPVIAAFTGSLVKVTANYFLIPIPQINIHGAVISTALCYIVAASINWYWLKRTSGIRIRFIELMKKPVLCSVIMGAVCFGVFQLLYNIVGFGNTISTLSAIIIAFISYFVLMITTKGLSNEDLCLLPFGRRFVSFLERKKNP